MKTKIKSLIHTLVQRYGYRLVLTDTYKSLLRDKEIVNSPASLLLQVDPAFQSRYSEGLNVTGTPESERIVLFKRQARFYNLLAIHRWASEIPGWQVECGCWKGLSSYLLNHQSKLLNSAHDGSGFMIVDSFEGLSQPTAEDSSRFALNPSLFTGDFFTQAGAFDCPQQTVRTALAEFPAIEYRQGWIPEVLSSLPERTYSFVHIDLDLHDPIRGGIDYFFPRLAEGGVIVLDDYGSLLWPGAMKAGDEGAAAFGQTLIPLSTGQAILVRR
jgi:O-methyltransferase